MGWLGKTRKKVSKLNQQYKAYQEKSQTERISKLKRTAEEEKLRTQVAKERSQRQKYSGGMGFNFGGFAGPTQKSPSASLGVSDYLLGSSSLDMSKPTTQAKTVKRRKKRKKSSSGGSKNIVIRVSR